MKVKELAGTRMIEVPDEWGETVENIKEIIPALKAAKTSGKTAVYINLNGDGSFSISVSNYSDTPDGGTWHYYTEYTCDDGYEHNYVNEYTKEEA